MKRWLMSEMSAPEEVAASTDYAVSADLAPKGALTVAAFRWLWFNNAFFFIVLNAQRFAFGWLVLDRLDGDERTQGIAVFALGIPALFLVLHAGAWADRNDRKKLLVGSQVASLAVMALTAAMINVDLISFNIVLVLAVVAGAASAIGQPVRAALVPALVDRSQLFNAIAVSALAMTASMILGPVLVQAVGDQFGFAAAFWFLTSLLVAGLLVLAPLRIPPRPPSEDSHDETADSSAAEDQSSDARPSVLTETKQAVVHVVGDPALKKLFFLLTVSGLTIMPAVMVSLQAFVKEDLGRDAGDAAPLLALMGVGIAISSLFLMRKSDMKNKGAAFQRAMMGGGTAVFLMGRTTEYWQLLPLVFLMGLCGGFYINMNQGLIQANTPAAMMGRVMGLFTLVAMGLFPIGALLIGLIASSVGIGATISGAAAIALVTVVVTYVTDEDLRYLS